MKEEEENWKKERDLVAKKQKPSLFLGRTVYNVNKAGYEFEDGSGFVPQEMKLDLQSERVAAEQMLAGGGIYLLEKMWDWKERLGYKNY